MIFKVLALISLLFAAPAAGAAGDKVVGATKAGAADGGATTVDVWPEGDGVPQALGQGG